MLPAFTGIVRFGFVFYAIHEQRHSSSWPLTRFSSPLITLFFRSVVHSICSYSCQRFLRLLGRSQFLGGMLQGAAKGWGLLKSQNYGHRIFHVWRLFTIMHRHHCVFHFFRIVPVRFGRSLCTLPLFVPISRIARLIPVGHAWLLRPVGHQSRSQSVKDRIDANVVDANRVKYILITHGAPSRRKPGKCGV